MTRSGCVMVMPPTIRLPGFAVLSAGLGAAAACGFRFAVLPPVISFMSPAGDALFHSNRDVAQCRDFLHRFQSPIVAAAMSLTAVRNHLPGRLFRSAEIRAAAPAVPRWIFAVSQAIACSSLS